MVHVPDSIFKDCDIRGVFGSELTPEGARKIGRAIGVKLAGKCVVVGGDVRLHTPALKEQIVQALKSSGCNVLDIGRVPTPVFHFALSQLSADGGVMVTASHNRAEYNGLKLVLGPLPPIREDVEEIRRIVAAGEEASGEGSATTLSVVRDYREGILRRFTPGGGVKVALDCGNGSYSEMAPEVFRELGYDVLPLFCEPDGAFPNRDPNPALPEHLSALSRMVKESDAELGVAFDGDGDRVVFTDENGQVVPAEHILVLLARRLLEGHSLASVVCDVKASAIVEEEVIRLGCVFIEEKSGHSYIRRRMILDAADLGGEVSGHFFYKDLGGGDDGLHTALLVARVLKESGRQLSQLTRGLGRYRITPDLRVPYNVEKARRLMMQLREFFSRERMSTLDGVKVYFEDGWGLLRPSVTEPVVTLRFEAHSGCHPSDIALRFLQPVPELLPLLAQEYPEWFDRVREC